MTGRTVFLGIRTRKRPTRNLESFRWNLLESLQTDVWVTGRRAPIAGEGATSESFGEVTTPLKSIQGPAWLNRCPKGIFWTIAGSASPGPPVPDRRPLHVERALERLRTAVLALASGHLPKTRVPPFACFRRDTVTEPFSASSRRATAHLLSTVRPTPSRISPPRQAGAGSHGQSQPSS